MFIYTELIEVVIFDVFVCFVNLNYMLFCSKYELKTMTTRAYVLPDCSCSTL